MLKFSEICLKRYKTAVLYLSFLSLGLSLAIPGPTLLDLQAIVQTDISHIASIYLARSSGYLLGSFLGGILLDYLKKKVLFLTVFNLIITVGVFATPWCRDVYTLVTVMAVSGLAMGALDTGGNVWCLDLWGENSSRYFQTLHFLFGVGAFSAPLIAEPYLAQENSEHSFSNISSPDNHLLNLSSFLSNSSFLKSLPSITYAYGIIGLFSLLVTLLFAVLFCVSVKEESKKQEKPNTNYKESNACISVLAICCASVLLSLYAGIEIGYGQMIATFCVKSDLHLSKATGSLITSVYWGTFTFSRGVSIVLASKLTPLSLIVTDFVLMLLASIILVLFGSSFVEFLWIGTAVLGLALASFYPTTITWVEKHLNISNKVASAFVIAASLGEMVVPLTISQFMNSFPEILLYIVVYSVVACGILIFILWIILKSIGNKYVIEQPVTNNRQENESCDLNVQSDSNENGSFDELNSQNEIEEDSL